jgi:RNA polymerase sigma factor (sigma-70 family)
MEAVHVRPPDRSDAAGSDVPIGEPDAAPGRVLPVTDFVDCYRLHYSRLVRALRLAGADNSAAEDAAQEAFARALVHWRRVSRGSNPAGYVYTAGFRLLARAGRRSGHEQPANTPAELSDDLHAASDPTGGSATSNAALISTLSAMPPRRRACAVMCLVVGLSAGEAGEALGIADGTVRKHLDEARKDLAVVLG